MGTFPKESVPEHLHRQVAHLVHHGFFDVNLNVALLQHHLGDVEAVLHVLRGGLRPQPSMPRPQASKPAVCLAKIKTGLARVKRGLQSARVTATQWAKGKVAAAQTRKAARIVAWLSCVLVLAVALASGPALLQAPPPHALSPHVCANLAATGIYVHQCPRPAPGLACAPLAAVKLSSAQLGGVTVQALQHPPRASHAHEYYYCAAPQPSTQRPPQQPHLEAQLRQAEHELRTSHQAQLHSQKQARVKEQRAEELVRQLNVELNQAKTELRRLQHVERTQEQVTRQRQRHAAKKVEKQTNALNKWQRELEATAKHQAEVARGLAAQGKQTERRAIELAQTQSRLAKDQKDLAKQHAALQTEREALQRDLAQQEVLSARAHNSRPSSPRVDKVTRDKPASASQYARMGVKELQKMLQRQGCRHCRNLVEKDQLVSAALHMFGMK